ncbi:hypothetical protein Fmac_008700 [Flemingia macrophylla]|uniref:Uncharacterized protein n=1 Tax=Flemingia macrophylla TaxID=520843 RepID=A0ABD1N0I7_9FABA
MMLLHLSCLHKHDIASDIVSGTIVVSSLMDSQGRKTLLITSFSGMATSMLLLYVSLSWKALAPYSGTLAVLGIVLIFVGENEEFLNDGRKPVLLIESKGHALNAFVNQEYQDNSATYPTIPHDNE